MLRWENDVLPHTCKGDMARPFPHGYFFMARPFPHGYVSLSWENSFAPSLDVTELVCTSLRFCAGSSTMERIQYPALREMDWQKPRGCGPKPNFWSIDADARSWARARSTTLYVHSRQVMPAIRSVSAGDFYGSLDGSGPKQGLSRGVQSSSMRYSSMRDTCARPRPPMLHTPARS